VAASLYHTKFWGVKEWLALHTKRTQKELSRFSFWFKLTIQILGIITFPYVALRVAVRTAIKNYQDRIYVTRIKTAWANVFARFLIIPQSSGSIGWIFFLQVFFGKGASN
jgi:hypothetical protein